MERFKGSGKKYIIFPIRKSYWQQDMHLYEYVMGAAIGLAVDGLVAWLFYQSWIAFLVLLPMQILWIRKWIRFLEQQKKKQATEEFKELMTDLIVALEAGYSVENAMKEAYKDMSRIYKKQTGMMRELSYMNRQLSVNVPVEQVWQACAFRVELDEVNQFVNAFVTAKRSGGNLIEIMRSVIGMIRDKTEVKREIATLLTAKRYEFQVMMGIPFGILFYMKLAFPEFMDVLYGNALGVGIMTVALGIYLGACVLGFHIVDIEV